MESERGLRARVATHGIGAFRPIIHLLVGIPLYIWMFGPMAAQADQSPVGCNGNGVRLNISRSPSPVPAGGTVTYTFSISNLDDGSIGLVACDVEDVDVVFYCPDANGSPDLSTPHVLTTTLNLPAGSVAQPVGSMQTCTMNVNPGVSDAVAEVRAGDQAGPLDNLAEGTLHDTVVDHPFRSQAQLGTFVVTATVTPTQTTTATPTQTATPTPTVTITPTPAILNHFQCYEIHGKSVASTVNLVDDTFGATTAAVGKPKRLCAPADKNDEDPTAPGDSDHLIAYGLRQTQPRAKDRQTVEVTNQFGTFALELTRADMLLVPSAKSIDITMPPQDYVPGIDHFKCHRIAGVRFRRSGITVDDQFPGTLTVDLKRPRRLCVAVEKNGELRIDPAASLLCYKERSLFASPRRGKVAILNQFEAGTFKVSEPRELCVPPLPNAGAPTPTPTATPTATATATPGPPNDADETATLTEDEVQADPVLLGFKLANAFDPDGDDLDIQSLGSATVSAVINAQDVSGDFSFVLVAFVGTLSHQGNSVATFTVDAETGSEIITSLDDTFWNSLGDGDSVVVQVDYTVTDGVFIDSSRQTVTIDGVNDAPVDAGEVL